ncbi:MAG: helix-hairpin-helix domain-containing protein [Acidobacteria bacterium]|nr:helix-hairpin-helix domain-containing protein [Acidobacteriota bacterium]MBK7935029.1 helix-hairpin-helix domain-containing protein [Acidobacteriota bacterium]
MAGCSTRVEYSSANAVGPSLNAININTASVEDLEKLPHIGRKTAEAIVEFRAVNGPFRRVEHLMQIRGVSEERFGALRPHIKIE